MWKLICLPFFLINIAFGDVDYWGISKKEIPSSLSKQKKNKKEEPPKTIKKEKDYKSAEELLSDSIKWYEEKIKKEKPPVEYYYFINPDNPIYQKAFLNYIKWKQMKTRKLVNPVIVYARGNNRDYKKELQELKEAGYKILYFYSPKCPHCKAMESEISVLEDFIDVYRINVLEDIDFALKWKVFATPTIIAVSPEEEKAFRVEGFRTIVELANILYNKWEKSKNQEEYEEYIQ